MTPTGDLQGDIGFRDGGGYVRITDRLKGMFTVGGFNVYPAGIERHLTGHPAVSRAAVVGVPDDRLGEVGRTYAIRAAAIFPHGLIAWCPALMAKCEAPGPWS